MSRRTRPKDPFRETKRRVVNEELRDRVHERFVAMYSMLRRRDVDASVSTDRARTMAADYAVANRERRRRDFGERGDGHLAPGTAKMDIPRGRKRR